MPDDELVLLTTEQGEPLSALRRMANGAHPRWTSSQATPWCTRRGRIPGNELAIDETINRLVGAGAQVVTPDDVPSARIGHGVRMTCCGCCSLCVRALRAHPRCGASPEGPCRTRAGLVSERTIIMENGDVLDVSADGVTPASAWSRGSPIRFVRHPGCGGGRRSRPSPHVGRRSGAGGVQVDAHDGSISGSPEIVTRGSRV